MTMQNRDFNFYGHYCAFRKICEYLCTYIETGAFQVALVVKNLPSNAGGIREVGSVPGSGRSPGGGNARHYSILAWRILRILGEYLENYTLKSISVLNCLKGRNPA